MDRAEVISTIVRVAAAAGLSFITFKYMLKYLDPSHASKEENKKKVELLFAKLGIDRTIELNEHELRIATQFVSSEDSGVEWDDIGGNDDLIAELKDRIILPLRIAAESGSALLCPPKGILLYGPPGCGKTLIAKAVARAAGCRFINLQVSNLTDKWYGESQKLAAAVFSVAQKFQPTIIFIDEIDSFLRDRQSHDHEATAMMKAQFMTLWDGFASTTDQIIVMGATNRPRDVDAAILRRMSARFMVPVPSDEQRRDILKVILREEKLADNVDLFELAKRAVSLSGSDLKEVCRIAVLRRAKATLTKYGHLHERKPVEQEDLEYAVQQYTKASHQMLEHALD